VLEGVIKSASQAVGLNFLAPVLYDPGTTDFTPFVTKLLGEKPDIVSFAGVPTGDACHVEPVSRLAEWTGLADSQHAPAAGCLR
jgi:hypothetical protein